MAGQSSGLGAVEGPGVGHSEHGMFKISIPKRLLITLGAGLAFIANSSFVRAWISGTLNTGVIYGENGRDGYDCYGHWMIFQWVASGRACLARFS